MNAGTVYAGGAFGTIGGQARPFLAALDSNGNPTGWDPAPNFAVLAVASSGSTVYVGGSLTSLGGQARNRVAALDAGGNLTGWNPDANDAVNALAVSGSTVYAGGAFTGIGGQARNRIAALDMSSGSATSWDPNADGAVNALAVSGSTVYAGGGFANIGGQARGHLAALDSSGAATGWNPNANADVYALALGGTAVYGVTAPRGAEHVALPQPLRLRAARSGDRGRQLYLSTVAFATWMPSLASSPTMRGEPQRGLALDILRRRSWTALAGLGLPGLGRERRVQWSRNLRRCRAMTVLGRTKTKASRQPAQVLDSHAQSNRSATLVRGRVGHRW